MFCSPIKTLGYQLLKGKRYLQDPLPLETRNKEFGAREKRNPGVLASRVPKPHLESVSTVERFGALEGNRSDSSPSV
jgi:hypothetical protein